MNSPTNLTLALINPGNVTVTLIAYYVFEQNSNNTYSNMVWKGPTIVGNDVGYANVITDNSLIFQTGHIYDITVVTARNNQLKVVTSL